MKAKKILSNFCVFLLLFSVFMVSTSITTKSSKNEFVSDIIFQINKIPRKVLQFIYIARLKNPDKIYIFVSEQSVSDQIINYSELNFDLSLFTFDAWPNKPSLEEIYAYMYEDKDKLVAFIGPQNSISPNVPAHEFGHMVSSITGYVSKDNEWIKICLKIWQEKTLHYYYMPSGHYDARGFSAEEQASEELFAECLAYLSEGRLDEFIGLENVKLAEKFIFNLVAIK